MYKLMVVAGPNRGTSFQVADGETSIGRQSGNSVVLPSSRVSKRHCVLIASNGKLVVRDEGSANGTFVNGVLSKKRKIRSGDRISVGEFVLEVVEPKNQTSGGSLIAFPGSHLPQTGLNSQGGSAISLHEAMSPPEPKTPKEKVIHAFDHYVMPFFYGLVMKNEWRMICVGIFGVFAILNLFISISPLLNSSRETVIKESGRRSTFMAREIADRAAPLLAARAETRMEIGAANTAEGVRLAVVTDMESRIIAPSDKLNQYLTSGPEAVLLTKVSKAFLAGRETGVVSEVDSDTVVSIEPVKVFNSQTGKNATIGMAIVSIDTSLATMGAGEVGLVYSETLIITAILGGLALIILYRMTLKPFQILNDDMDKVLKGDMNQVTREFKFEEMNPLWDLINSALQRVPKSSSSAFGGTGKIEPSINAEDFLQPLRALGTLINGAIAVCDGDRKILYLSPTFEDATGIRSDNSLGQDFGSVSRDQAMAALVSDLFDRAQQGGEITTEDFEFSGVGHKVSALGFGPSGTVKCYLLIALKGAE